MPVEHSMRDVLRNMLQYGDLSFRDFVEVALYHPQFGYYTRARSPLGKEGDFITGPSLSPAFAYAIGNLVRDLVRRNTDVVSTVVDIGCGSGELVRGLQGIEKTEIFGIDRGQFISLLDPPECDIEHFQPTRHLESDQAFLDTVDSGRLRVDGHDRPSDRASWLPMAW